MAYSTQDSPSSHFLDDTLAAYSAGIDIEHYLAARSAGASHTEVLLARWLGQLPAHYATLRRHGATHAQAVRITTARITTTPTLVV